MSCHPPSSMLRRALLSVALLLAAGLPLLSAAAEVVADSTPQASDVAIWTRIRASLYGTRPIRDNADDVVRLEAPARAEDASTVPVAIRVPMPQTPERHVRTLWLLVDRNPSPIAAVFALTPDSGRADIETRIRIEQYTDVRAVAELNDGSLHMATRRVKASGGCSAPAGKDPADALRNVGRMKFRIDGPAQAGTPVAAQLAISHPNASGLVLDPVSRLYQPPYYVRRLTVSYAGMPVLTADIDFSISENPNFRFWFVPRGDGVLRAEVIDTHDLTFSSQVPVSLGDAAAPP